jgi:Tfp pilus assembly protein PilF
VQGPPFFVLRVSFSALHYLLDVYCEGTNAQRAGKSNRLLRNWSNKATFAVERATGQGAEESYRRAVTIDPQCSPAWSELGCFLVDGHRFSEAAPCFQSSIERSLPTKPIPTPILSGRSAC